ncbi:hypothetical protein [Aeropyrum camini]|uniref:Predicted membrane protein n=1 Tax=Aeropyrum camini SY1 = JCM 12091 TaxID=1198449 RepID=U3TEA2_9CREN|nr:hypothetical protein [Aeropyrum camini]BAN90766.1 predicted membrane protein [Aeropyrum camini SY1 = JCM 12091]
MRGSASTRPLVTGVIFIAVGIVLGIAYPYLLLDSNIEKFLAIVRYTLIAVSIVVGALFISTGSILIYGWLKFHAKSSGEE